MGRCQPILIFLTISIAALFMSVNSKQCIKTKVGQSCEEDHDCFEQNELHLFCNKSKGENKCAFHYETYIGHVTKDVDCEGQEFSSEPWSNPIDQELISKGIDCMRMCLHVQTCFGATIVGNDCFLKNEKCFTNLKPREGALVGVLNVVREDYKCGCHYPFTRKTSAGEILTWNPECPASQLTSNPYRCCSDRGLCVECNPTSNTRGSSLRKLFTQYAK